jgi:uncharacterized protein
MQTLSTKIQFYLLPALSAILVLITVGALSCLGDADKRGAQNGKESERVARLDEPGLIDVHAHIGEFKGYDLSLSTLLKNIEENRVQYAFISNIDGAAIPGVTANGDEIKINEETARASAAHPKLKPLAWAKPGANGASAANIEPFLRDKKFYGIKFHPDFNNFSASSTDVIPYLKLCEKYNVPALFHCGRSSRSNPKVLYEVAKQFPAVPFVFYHMGFGTAHEEAIEVAREAKTKKDAIIYLETAQADADAVKKAIKILGADRVIFGSDATYYGSNHYEFYVPVLREVKQTISAADYQLFIHGNAVKLFRLEEK